MTRRWNLYVFVVFLPLLRVVHFPHKNVRVRNIGQMEMLKRENVLLLD